TGHAAAPDAAGQLGQTCPIYIHGVDRTAGYWAAGEGELAAVRRESRTEVVEAGIVDQQMPAAAIGVHLVNLLVAGLVALEDDLRAVRRPDRRKSLTVP